MSRMDPRWMKRWRYEREHGITRYVDPAPVAAHIRELRRAGASRRAIAQKAGVSPSVITRVLDGQAHIRRPTAAAVLVVTPGSIFNRDGGQDFVPGIGARRRVQALLAMGWSHRHITAAMGADAPRHTSRNLLHKPGGWVSRANHQRAITAYDTLWAAPGPSEKTRRLATKNGWAPPLAWDDETIDDPGTVPLHRMQPQDHGELDEGAVQRRMNGDRDVKLTRQERCTVVGRLHAQGLNDQQIERRTGINSRQVLRDRQALDLTANRLPA